MLAARGVSLGLGKINLSDLNQLPSDKLRIAQIKREVKPKKPKVIIKKKADAKTVWAACRAVIFGCIVIGIGLAMTVLGYFDKHFSERILVVSGISSIYYDKMVQYQLKSMQYIGPILMGIGSFILIIACVVTLESRDKHAQVITEESISHKRRRLLSMSIEERGDGLDGKVERDDHTGKPIILNRYSISTLAEVHRPGQSEEAPLAELDSLDLHSCSSQVTTERDQSGAKNNEQAMHISGNFVDATNSSDEFF